MVLGYLAVASALLITSATAFNNVLPYNNKVRTISTQLYASGPGYKIGAKTEGVLINNRYVVDELAKAVPGKSALVLFYHVHVCVSYEVSVI